jgi:hypothetical protein
MFQEPKQILSDMYDNDPLPYGRVTVRVLQVSEMEEPGLSNYSFHRKALGVMKGVLLLKPNMALNMPSLQLSHI